MIENNLFEKQEVKKRVNWNYFLTGFLICALILGIVAYNSLEREDIKFFDNVKNNLFGRVEAKIIANCDPDQASSDYCTSACEPIFENFAGFSGFVYSSGACYDMDEMMEQSWYVRSDGTICDDNLGAGSGQCAVISSIMTGSLYCPSYERNGNVAVDGDDCYCYDDMMMEECFPTFANYFNFTHPFFSEADSDTTPPTFTGVYNVTHYTNEEARGWFNATDETDFDCWAVNNTANFSINCTGGLTNISTLSVGIHFLNLTINDSMNNLNSLVINVTTLAEIIPPRTLKGIKNSTGDIIWMIYDNGSVWSAG